jgi:thiamine biosynthesis protein ThiS
MRMRIRLNGVDLDVEDGITLPALLERLTADPRHVGVERNGEVVERGRFGEVVLQATDRVEVVRFVGGG